MLTLYRRHHELRSIESRMAKDLGVPESKVLLLPSSNEEKHRAVILFILGVSGGLLSKASSFLEDIHVLSLSNPLSWSQSLQLGGYFFAAAGFFTSIKLAFNYLYLRSKVQEALNQKGLIDLVRNQLAVIEKTPSLSPVVLTYPGFFIQLGLYYVPLSPCLISRQLNIKIILNS